MRKLLPTLFVALFLSTIVPAASAASLEQIGEFAIPEAYQGIGVDDRYFYAVHNRIIAKYEKKTGKPAGKWEGPKDGPIAHLDSAMVMDGKIFAAHSNYPEWPMTSSLEIWDAATLQHIGSHSFGINWNSSKPSPRTSGARALHGTAATAACSMASSARRAREGTRAAATRSPCSGCLTYHKQ